MHLSSGFTRECLQDAGWTENRSIPTSAFVEANRDAGFLVSEKAISFLSRFGDLELRYPHFRVPKHDDKCSFDATFAAQMAIPGLISDYERAIGSRLTVIGEACHQHMTLCMDEEGRVYGGFEDTLVKFGESGEDAIVCLCEGREGVHIDVNPPQIPPFREDIELSDLALSALRQAGWKKPTADTRQGNQASRFLTEFGGISLHYKNCDNESHVCIFERLDVPQAFLDEVSRITEQHVTPVGELPAPGMILLMDDEGRIFGSMLEVPELIYLFGVSGTDAINNLILGRDVQRIS